MPHSKKGCRQTGTLIMSPDFSMDEALQGAIACLQQGDFAHAQDYCRRIFSADQNNLEATLVMGMIAGAAGNADQSIKWYRRATELEPDSPEIFNNLGNVCRGAGRHRESEDAYRKAVNLAPDFAEALNNLALSICDQGRGEESIPLFREAIELQPEIGQIRNNLGIVLLELRRDAEAADVFGEAVRLNPADGEALNNLGTALKNLGRRDEARAAFEQALCVAPGLAEVHYNLGLLLLEDRKFEASISCLEEAIRLNPGMAEAYANLGAIHWELGFQEKSASLFEKAHHLKPDHPGARLGLCISRLKICYSSQEDMAASRERYEEELHRLITFLNDARPETRLQAADLAGRLLPFFLAYQGQDDVRLQRAHGEMVSRLLGERYPEWSKPLSMPARSPGDKIRVGFATAYFFQHSVWKIPLRGWVENLDRGQFELFGYHLGRKRDSSTDDARKCFGHFREGFGSLEEICRTVLADRLHVLIIPEIGMDPTTARMAALRLAPVQCTGMGHPVTSGFPTIDYYLSSDLMEPEEADSYYSEKLVRLPNLSFHYTPPAITPSALRRRDLGLEEGEVLYFCAQSLYKYLPQYDFVFPRIARDVPGTRFVFLDFPNSPWIGELFMARLKRAFGVFGLEAESFVKMLPHLPPADFAAVNRICDIFLDSVGWSGLNSTYEALAAGLPVATTPGRFMRGRHTAAMLKMMGCPEGVGATIEDYIQIASRLGNDAGWRREVAAKMSRSRQLLYADMETIHGLEQFLRQVTHSKEETSRAMSRLDKARMSNVPAVMAASANRFQPQKRRRDIALQKIPHHWTFAFFIRSLFALPGN
jgi:protein O-GlcNAc transferase